jgi:hypothetical protein
VSSPSRPIFVVGFQRSGTTLLQSLIGSHPRIAAPPETFFLFRIARLAGYYGDLTDDANLARVVHDAVHPPAGLLDGAGFDEAVLMERARSRPRTMRAVFEVMMEDFAERHGKVRWSEKSPGQNAGEVLGTFPDAQVIHIVRDPRDAIASSLETPWTAPDVFALAHEWKTFFGGTTRSGSRAGPAHFMQIRYEDLTRDTATVLAQVFGFLGEDFDPAEHTDPEKRRATVSQGASWQARVLEDIQPAVEGGWRDKLDRSDRQMAAGILHDEIASLGYEPSSRVDIQAGKIAAVPRRVAAWNRQRKLIGTMRDPQRLYDATHAYLAELAQRIERSAADA